MKKEEIKKKTPKELSNKIEELKKACCMDRITIESKGKKFNKKMARKTIARIKTFQTETQKKEKLAKESK